MTRYRIYPKEHLASASRAELAAWLAIERADLLAQLTGLDERILCEQPVMGDWTAKDLLAHVANWDAFFTESVTMALAGRAGEAPDVVMAERNAEVHAERQNWSLAATLEECAGARARFLELLDRAPLEALDVEWQFGWGNASLRRCTRWRGYHDCEHADQIGKWRKTLAPASRRDRVAGSKPVLVACLDVHRAALLAAMALIPAAERETRSLCDAWTLRDVVGHLADWEAVCHGVMQQIAAGRSPELDYDGDTDAWNATHVTARREQPWPAAWNDFEAARRSLLDLLDGLSEAELNRPIDGRWGGTPYGWACACLEHDQEHAYGLAALLGILDADSAESREEVIPWT